MSEMRRSRKANGRQKLSERSEFFCRSIERNNFRRFTLGCPFGSFGQAKEQVQNFKPARFCLPLTGVLLRGQKYMRKFTSRQKNYDEVNVHFDLCSAFTTEYIPPLTVNSPFTSIHFGFNTLTRSSRILFTTFS